VVERGVRASHMEHQWDFYKPNMESEYPTVDGKNSMTCFIRAVDKTYALFKEKLSRMENRPITRADLDYCVFHTPFNKLVQKAYGRLLYSDFCDDQAGPGYDTLQPFKSLSRMDSETNTDLEKACVNATKTDYDLRVIPSTRLSKECGNMYTASLYAGLASLVNTVPPAGLLGKRIALFSYGSGFAATMFSIKVKRSTAKLARSLDLDTLLSRRALVAPSELYAAMEHRERTHNDIPFEPIDDPEVTLPPATFYLTGVDDKGRRAYARTGIQRA